jgi:fructokinase
VHVPATPARVVDTVGAGDAFNAGLLAWLAEHGRLTKGAVRALDAGAVADALRFAGLVAARTCERPGADPPWRHDLPEELP